MSLLREVSKAVVAKGRATVDDVAPLFPHRTREQVRTALHDAKNFGLVRLVEKGRSYGYRDGYAPGVYGPPTEERVSHAVRLEDVWRRA